MIVVETRQCLVPTEQNDLREGDIITGPNKIKVYAIKNNHKRHILNPDVFKMYLHLKWENIKQVSEETLNSFKTSNLYRSIDNYRTYLLEETNEGKGIKHYLDSNPEGAFIVNKEEEEYYEESD